MNRQKIPQFLLTNSPRAFLPTAEPQQGFITLIIPLNLLYFIPAASCWLQTKVPLPACLSFPAKTILSVYFNKHYTPPHRHILSMWNIFFCYPKIFSVHADTPFLLLPLQAAVLSAGVNPALSDSKNGSNISGAVLSGKYQWNRRPTVPSSVLNMLTGIFQNCPNFTAGIVPAFIIR